MKYIVIGLMDWFDSDYFHASDVLSNLDISIALSKEDAVRIICGRPKHPHEPDLYYAIYSFKDEFEALFYRGKELK